MEPLHTFDVKLIGPTIFKAIWQLVSTLSTVPQNLTFCNRLIRLTSHNYLTLCTDGRNITYTVFLSKTFNQYLTVRKIMKTKLT